MARREVSQDYLPGTFGIALLEVSDSIFETHVRGQYAVFEGFVYVAHVDEFIGIVSLDEIGCASAIYLIVPVGISGEQDCSAFGMID